MRPAWFLLLALWACDATLSAHALSIVPNGLRHSLRKRDASSAKNKIKVYDLHVESHIEHRFATTRISSRIANAGNDSQEVFFNVVIPETAFISGFKMEVDDKVYEAYVKEKDAAKREYTEAVARGQTAAHVAASARDSNRFTVSVNVEPTKKVTFNLTYDELLTRRMGTYNLAINLDPGKLVRSMSINVFIKENRNITVLRVPELRTGNEVDADETTAGNSLATIVRTSPTEAHVSFSPTAKQQKSLGHVGAHNGSKKTLRGQFVVQYDVDRDSQAGDVLVNDGYFVHFFAPKNMVPLRKHAIFVLDVSGSMASRKLDQLKDAMVTILDNLNEGDYFNIIEFSDDVKVWDLESMPERATRGWTPTCRQHGYHQTSSCDAVSLVLAPPFPVTLGYITKAKHHVKNMRIVGGTNIHDALKVAIKVAHASLDNRAGLPDTEEMRTPLIIFLTDGQPTHAGTDTILATVKERNHNPTVAIFSLAFGNDADLDFLKTLSLRNLAFARKIYQASDAALQLRDFYRQIASPLLANVTFSYQKDKVVQEATTKSHFPTLFLGSEIVVAGKLQNEVTIDDTGYSSLGVDVLGVSHSGTMNRSRLVPYPCHEMPVNHTVTSLEKLWAYLTIKQLLEARDTRGSDVTVTDANNTAKLGALELALKYSFVTPLTSLVVVKPNASELMGQGGTGRRRFQGRAGSSHRVMMMTRPHHQPHAYAPSSAEWTDNGPLSSVPYDWYDNESEETSVEEYTTSASETPALIRPEELEWLEATSHGYEVTLPFGPSGTNMTYWLLPDSGTYHVNVNCTTKRGDEGFCQHLRDCPLNVIKHNVQAYSAYFCTLKNFAGICCPSHLAKPLTILKSKHQEDTTSR